jgi:hypothetical protein
MAETIDTDALRAIAGKFDTEVGKHLDEAMADLAGVKDLEYANFTTVAWSLATAYVEAANFQARDLQTKRQWTKDYDKRLAKTADDWDKGDHASKPKVN